jgi:hypothetical protein
MSARPIAAPPVSRFGGWGRTGFVVVGAVVVLVAVTAGAWTVSSVIQGAPAERLTLLVTFVLAGLFGLALIAIGLFSTTWTVYPDRLEVRRRGAATAYPFASAQDFALTADASLSLTADGVTVHLPVDELTDAERHDLLAALQAARLAVRPQ